MFRISPVVISGLIGMTTATIAEAQLVRVGPFGGVEVRLPRLGVSVDVLPFWGGTRVRAPFTSVDTGWYQYGDRWSPYTGEVAPQYPQPTYAPPPVADSAYRGSRFADTATQLSDNHQSGPNDDDPSAAEALGQDLRAAAERLRISLAQRPDGGETWLSYLAPDQIIAAIDHRSAPQSLRNLLMNYEGVVNSQLNDILSADGFDQTHRLLGLWIHGSRELGREEDSSVEELPAPAATPLG